MSLLEAIAAGKELMFEDLPDTKVTVLRTDLPGDFPIAVCWTDSVGDGRADTISRLGQARRGRGTVVVRPSIKKLAKYVGVCRAGDTVWMSAVLYDTEEEVLEFAKANTNSLKLVKVVKVEEEVEL